MHVICCVISNTIAEQLLAQSLCNFLHNLVCRCYNYSQSERVINVSHVTLVFSCAQRAPQLENSQLLQLLSFWLQFPRKAVCKQITKTSFAILNNFINLLFFITNAVTFSISSIALFLYEFVLQIVTDGNGKKSDVSC